MKIEYQCRFKRCIQTFNHPQKRIRHEIKHKKSSPKQKKSYKKSWTCTCCAPPRSFRSAKARQNHKHYTTHKHKFECQKCTEVFSTKQVMIIHETNCCGFFMRMAMMNKALMKSVKEARQDLQRENEDSQNFTEEDDTQDQTYQTDQTAQTEEREPKKSNRCQDKDCRKYITESSSGWWCSGCGYGLCAECRPYYALNHVYQCQNVHKQIFQQKKKIQ